MAVAGAVAVAGTGEVVVVVVAGTVCGLFVLVVAGGGAVDECSVMDCRKWMKVKV